MRRIVADIWYSLRDYLETFGASQIFLKLAAEAELQPAVTCYSLEHANQALDDLRDGRLTGAAVLTIGQ